MVKEIPLTQGKVAIVDDEDYERVMQYKWSTRKVTNQLWYARRYINRRQENMSKLILNTTEMVDHIDGDGLNNTKANLRISTVKQNAWNRRKMDVPTSSKYKGVAKIPGRDSWQCRIFVDGKRVYIGYFTSEIEAARAYDAKAVELYGEYAKLNFPKSCTKTDAEETK